MFRGFYAHDRARALSLINERLAKRIVRSQRPFHTERLDHESTSQIQDTVSECYKLQVDAARQVSRARIQVRISCLSAHRAWVSASDETFDDQRHWASIHDLSDVAIPTVASLIDRESGWSLFRQGVGYIAGTDQQQSTTITRSALTFSRFTLRSSPRGDWRHAVPVLPTSSLEILSLPEYRGPFVAFQTTNELTAASISNSDSSRR